MWSSPARWSTAKQAVIACMLSGWAGAAACGSPVSSRDSAPVTCSTPASGSSSPVSVASMNHVRRLDGRAPGRAQRDRATRSPSGRRRRGVLAQHLDRGAGDGAGRRCTASAARGSWQRRLTVAGARVESGRAGPPASAGCRAVVGADRVAQRAVARGAAEPPSIHGCSSSGRAWLVSWPPSQSVSSVRTTPGAALAAPSRGRLSPAAWHEHPSALRSGGPEKKKNQTSNASAAISTADQHDVERRIAGARRWSRRRSPLRGCAATAAGAAAPAGPRSAGRAARRARPSSLIRREARPHHHRDHGEHRAHAQPRRRPGAGCPPTAQQRAPVQMFTAVTAIAASRLGALRRAPCPARQRRRSQRRWGRRGGGRTGSTRRRRSAERWNSA